MIVSWELFKIPMKTDVPNQNTYVNASASAKPCILQMYSGRTFFFFYKIWCIYCVPNIDGLVQERRNSSGLAMELCLSFINP